MAYYSYVRARNITISPSPGVTIDSSDFGLEAGYTFLYFELRNISTGVIQIRFHDDDDWVEISLPYSLNKISAKDIRLQTDQASDQTVDVIASFAYTYGTI